MKNTHRFLLGAIALGCAASTAQARGTADGWDVSGPSLVRQGDFMAAGLTLRLSDLDVPSDKALLLTPMIVNGNDTLALHSVGIYGRSRYYHYLRRSDTMLSGHDEITVRQSEKPDTLQYEAIVPFQSWMEGASLMIGSTLYGCCSTALAADTGPTLASYAPLHMPPIKPVYVAAKASGEKTESLADRAYIEFVVNRTEIEPDYRDNHKELARIRHSIDTVMSDPDFTVTAIHLKGYASPESPYAHNDRLAAGRTEALRKYIMQLYDFPASMIGTDHEGEDWEGLAEYVRASNLESRDAILEIAARDMDPDQKEALIKKNFPEDYAFLLRHAYPALRHTDYRVDYTIRRFTDTAEISRIFDENPRKLSLEELYLLAAEEKPGSDRFNDIYLTAARMYPADTTANLNAASASLQSGDTASAERYLRNAGTGIEAAYTRGIAAILKGDAATALPLLRQAAAYGIDGAEEMVSYAQAILSEK